jgi:hypothetical protein
MDLSILKSGLNYLSFLRKTSKFLLTIGNSADHDQTVQICQLIFIFTGNVGIFHLITDICKHQCVTTLPIIFIQEFYFHTEQLIWQTYKKVYRIHIQMVTKYKLTIHITFIKCNMKKAIFC